jgi:hypothetical protein
MRRLPAARHASPERDWLLLLGIMDLNAAMRLLLSGVLLLSLLQLLLKILLMACLNPLAERGDWHACGEPSGCGCGCGCCGGGGEDSCRTCPTFSGSGLMAAPAPALPSTHCHALLMLLLRCRTGTPAPAAASGARCWRLARLRRASWRRLHLAGATQLLLWLLGCCAAAASHTAQGAATRACAVGRRC